MWTTNTQTDYASADRKPIRLRAHLAEPLAGVSTKPSVAMIIDPSAGRGQS
jgi:hypothetical protein